MACAAVACAFRSSALNLVSLSYLVVMLQACKNQLFVFVILALELFMATGSRLTMRERVGYLFFSAWALNVPVPLLAAMAAYAYGLCVGQLIVRRCLRWDHAQWIPWACEWLAAGVVTLVARQLWLAYAPAFHIFLTRKLNSSNAP